MFIREVKKQRSPSARVFYQYSLVQAARVEGKVKQRVILYLGSDTELRDKNSRDLVLQALKAKLFGQPELFPEDIPPHLRKLALSYYQKYRIKYGEAPADEVSLPPKREQADYHQVDIRGMELVDVKSFGGEHLCRQVLEKLRLEDCFRSLGMSGGQARRGLLAIAARALFSSSEHKTARILTMNSELGACYGQKPLTHKQLYQIGDQLYEHKEQIDRFLYRRITDLFDINDKLVIFDLSNTYFETGKAGSRLARYPRSKERRNDCPVVVFTGVINPQGFIRHSRIYEGGRPDPQTLEEMIADLEAHSGGASKKTIVMDAGIATEDNLTLLRQKEYEYVCVSRKRLKAYPESVQDQVVRQTARGKGQVQLSVFHPEGQPDTWMYVQSPAKRKKEESMNQKLSARFEQDLQTIRAAFDKKGGTKNIEKVWERIGRARQKHRRVSGRYQISVDQREGKATGMRWERKPDPVKEDKEKGVYFIRTSYEHPSEGELWDIYNTIREVESTFRCLKTDLQLRPVYHQNEDRIEAHLYLTILAYQLVNTIRYMLGQKGIHYDWRNIRRIMSTQTIQTVELPTDKKTIHLRKPSKPIAEVQQIYKATGCRDTQKTVKKYVVYH